MAKNFKKTAIKTEKNKKKFKKRDSFVIARSEATKQSRKRECGTLDCFATLAMTGRIDCHDFLAKFSNDFVLKIAASSAAMTG